jgi:hypothetical protein
VVVTQDPPGSADDVFRHINKKKITIIIKENNSFARKYISSFARLVKISIFNEYMRMESWLELKGF